MNAERRILDTRPASKATPARGSTTRLDATTWNEIRALPPARLGGPVGELESREAAIREIVRKGRRAALLKTIATPTPRLDAAKIRLNGK